MHRIIILLLISFLAIKCRQSAIPLNRPDINRIRTDLERITKTEKSRNHNNIDILNETAAYIHSELSKQCDTVFYQTFVVDNKEYKNVIGSVGSQHKERIIIGAHYDVAGEQEGADDNASGVAGLLESARILSNEKLGYRIDFVAYSLEEPPYYASKNMGSYIHAKSMYDERINVKGMICLEMIGYFSDESNSQQYPLGFLRWFYGNKGDFITVVQKYNNGSFGKKLKKLMTGQKLLPTRSFTGPAKLQGIDFSDHRNYWKFGYSAVMITNTAFYRNPNYHQITDKMETLDLERMTKVIEELCVCMVNLF
jgi:Zn-dependent M28 family amino/carboxypeptidase